MKLKEIITRCQKDLEKSGIDSPLSEVFHIVSFILGIEMTEIYLNLDLDIDDISVEKILYYVSERAKRIPLPYILKEINFMGLNFKINKNCFIPRQETEVLTEAVINFINRSQNKDLRLLDLGTGCGNIAISIAKYTGLRHVYATDISKEAINVAKYNAKINGVNVKFFVGDMFHPLVKYGIKVDIIVSNPPYLSSFDFINIQPEIKHEPRISFDGGNDGLDFYRKIFSSLHLVLKRNCIHDKSVYCISNTQGLLFLEIGYNMKSSILKLLNYYRVKLLNIFKDYLGHERVIFCGYG